MSVEQLDKVDILSVDPRTGHVVLGISDQLDWTESIDHRLILQAKFNTYLAFIESGEILDRYPDARDRPVAIRVFFKHNPDTDG